MFDGARVDVHTGSGDVMEEQNSPGALLRLGCAPQGVKDFIDDLAVWFVSHSRDSPGLGLISVFKFSCFAQALLELKVGPCKYTDYVEDVKRKIIRDMLKRALR